MDTHQPEDSLKAPAQKFDRSIVEGPLGPAVWRLSWPTMLQNAITGLQGIVDHVMVGQFVGYRGNAAVGVSWQIISVVIVFISSLFTGMGVLVARFAGADEPEKVNHVVYQAFLTVLALSSVMAIGGYCASPTLLAVVNAAPEVKALALPFMRAMFSSIFGLMMFFMLTGAFRAAGDPRTPLRLGVGMTALIIVFNLILVPKMGALGAALSTIASSASVAIYGVWRLFTPSSVIRFHSRMDLRPDWTVIRSLFRFGLPAGLQGIVMNITGVLVLRFIGSIEHSAAAQAAYAVGYSELFSLITWTSAGLMGASATIAGQSLGAGHSHRAMRCSGCLVVRSKRRRDRWISIHGLPAAPAGDFRNERCGCTFLRGAVAALSEPIGVFHHCGTDLHRRTSMHGGHARRFVYLDPVTNRRSDWVVRYFRGLAWTTASRYLACNLAWPLHACVIERTSLPSGQVAAYRRRHRIQVGLAIILVWVHPANKFGQILCAITMPLLDALEFLQAAVASCRISEC